MKIDSDYLIIGGGIAGTTAAETIRNEDQNAKIALISDEEHFLYSRVLLPHYVMGRVGLDSVMLRTLSDYEKNKIDLYLEEGVRSIDVQAKKVHTFSRKSFGFKKLLISSGGRVRPWKPEKENVFRLQTLEDADRLKEFLKNKKPSRAVVVGGGFIALEFINVLLEHGVKPILVCRDLRFWNERLDDDGHFLLRKVWERHSIDVIENDEVDVIKGGKEGLIVFTKRVRRLEADMICVGIGLKKNYDLVQGICKVNEHGIIVNEYLETSCNDVWAAGDVAGCGNWSCSFMQGQVAGLNMVGMQTEFKRISSYSIKFLDSVVTFLGHTKELKDISTITRFDEVGKKYIRFFLEDDKLIGAVLINEQKNIGIITKLIEEKRHVGKFRAELMNPMLDLEKLLD